MRTWVVGLAACVVVGTPLCAAAGTTAPEKIVVVPIDGKTGTEPALTDALLQAIVSGASQKGRVVRPVKASCRDADCFARVAADNDAAYVIAATVTANINDYRIELIAYDTAGTVRRSSKFDCQICTQPELVQRLQHETAALRSELDVSAPVAAGAAPEAGPARVAITSTPDGARVLVDGTRVGTTPYEGEVGPGTHTLRIEARGYAAQIASFEAKGGGESAFAIALQRDEATNASRGRRLRIAGYSSLSVGVGALVAGAVLLAIDSRPVRGRCTPDRIDINGECEFVHDTIAVGAVLTSVGAAAIVTGIALAIVGRRKSKSKSKSDGSHRRAAVTLRGVRF